MAIGAFFGRWESWTLISAAVFIFSVYLVTLSPSIAGGDSGELVAEGCILGTAHPPGYPLLTLIVYLLKDAIFTVSASVAISKTVLLLTPIDEVEKNQIFKCINVSGAVFAAGMFSFSPLIWQYAVTAEVFPLNTFLSSFIVYLTVLFSHTGELKLSYWGALVCGLGLCNQHTIVLFEFPLILWMLFLLRRNILSCPSFILRYISLMLLGLAFYAYLPIVSHISPKAGSWGYLGSLSGFLHHFLRKDYGTFQLFSGNAGEKTAGLWERNLAYVEDLFTTQGSYIVFPLACFYVTHTMIVLFRMAYPSKKVSPARKVSAMTKKASKSKNEGKDKKGDAVCDDGNVCKSEVALKEGRDYVVLVLVSTLGFYFMFFHSLSNLPLDNKLLYGVHQRFWMQPSIITFIFAGVGFNILLKKSFSCLDRFDISTVKVLSLLLALLLCCMQLHRWFAVSDQSGAVYFRDYAKALVEPLPNHSILIINYDMQWTSVRYMQKCELMRPDVTVINLSMMTYKWFEQQRHLFPSNISFPGLYHSHENSIDVSTGNGFTFSQFMDSNSKHKIFFSGKMSFRDSRFDAVYDHEPFGLVSRIVLKSKMSKAADYKTSLTSSWSSVASYVLSNLPEEAKYPEETWEWTIGRDMKDRLTDAASFFLELAIPEAKKDPSSLIESIYWLESALYFEGGVNNSTASSALLKNTGLAHANLIQNKKLPQGKPLPQNPSQDVLGTLKHLDWPSTEKWKIWSTERFLNTWGEFLSRPDSIHDSQYATIKQMYDVATGIHKSKK